MAEALYTGTGRRKCAVSRVRISPGSGNIVVNGHDISDYFDSSVLQIRVREPLEAIGVVGNYDIDVKVHGGGLSGQAGAVRHGIGRALLQADPDYRAPLKKAGLLTRDPRMKERKKYGLKKARKAPQFSKR